MFQLNARRDRPWLQRRPAYGRLASWRLLAVCATFILFGTGLAHAAKVTERTKQKRQAESERAGLQQKLQNLKRDIQKTEGAKEHAADNLAKSELAISTANRALHELATEQQQTEQRLLLLSEQQAELTRSVTDQQKQLARLIRQQYQTGSEDRTRLLLSGDNPNRINRELRYLGYVSQAQAHLIDTLQASLQDIEANQAQTQNARDELDEIAQEARAQKQVLEQEKARRAALIAQLSDKLAVQRKEVDLITRNEQRLGSLVNKLAQLIEEQQKTEAAAALRRQQEAERLRQAQRAARSKAAPAKPAAGRSAAPPKMADPDAIDDDEPPKSLAQNELTPQPPVQKGGTAPAFSALRGQLRVPVQGELLAKFGSRREDGPSWKGLFIRATEGSSIKSVAAGRVVFADWLRGFGNLIIIDHGNHYLSIYGYNQAVLKHTGDFVNMGDVIASAGNSGGLGQSGLYFEIRHQGRALDPLGWINFR